MPSKRTEVEAIKKGSRGEGKKIADEKRSPTNLSIGGGAATCSAKGKLRKANLGRGRHSVHGPSRKAKKGTFRNFAVARVIDIELTTKKKKKRGTRL